VYNPFIESGDEISDEQLVSGAREGDQQALERLFRRHQPWVYNIAVRMLLQRADA
jgi:DNA-directed RNA polymerase specialized sigma24 family protein